MIRLALLDDHPAVLAGLRRLLEPTREMEVLASGADPIALARELRGRRPDVVILDYDPARGDALALCRRIKARRGAPGVLIYTAYANDALTIAARAAQADGVLDKSEPATALLDAIRRIANGESVMPTVGRLDFDAAVARLDDADLPLFALLIDGAPLPAIAEQLRTDEHEASRRTQRIIRRLRPAHGDVTVRSVRGGSHSA
jgi:DNA-binding NarL/FixJ family response regulator